MIYCHAVINYKYMYVSTKMCKFVFWVYEIKDRKKTKKDETLKNINGYNCSYISFLIYLLVTGWNTHILVCFTHLLIIFRCNCYKICYEYTWIYEFLDFEEIYEHFQLSSSKYHEIRDDFTNAISCLFVFFFKIWVIM